MKTLILGLFLISSFSVFGQVSTIENADLRCEQKGGAIAIKLPRNGAEARVWQTDPGETEGLELTDLTFRMMRCPGCFTFEGRLFGMDVRGKVMKFVLDYEAFDPDEAEWVELMSGVKCNKK